MRTKKNQLQVFATKNNNKFQFQFTQSNTILCCFSSYQCHKIFYSHYYILYIIITIMLIANTTTTTSNNNNNTDNDGNMNNI